MTPRSAALLRERAELQRQLARVDAALADEAEGAAPPTPELAARRARADVDRLLARTGR